MEFKEKYVRIHEGNHWKSVCRECFLTAALAGSCEQLEDGEHEHKCGVSILKPYDNLPEQLR